MLRVIILIEVYIHRVKVVRIDSDFCFACLGLSGWSNG